MNTFDDCEICGNVTASVTVRTSDDAIRVCGGCYTRHYDANAESAVAWEAEFDAPLYTPDELFAADAEAAACVDEPWAFPFADDAQPLPRRPRARFAQWHPGAALLKAHERAVIVPILRAFWQGAPLTKAQRRVVRGWK